MPPGHLPDLILLGGAGRQDDDGGQILLPDGADGVQTVPVGQAEVQDDEIRLFDINKERQDKVAVVVDWVLHKELNTDIKPVSYTHLDVYKRQTNRRR